jgi:hypothetical protein
MIPKFKVSNRDVDCPTCHAVMGQPCVRDGYQIDTIHAGRVRDSMLSFIRGDNHVTPQPHTVDNIVERVARAILAETEEYPVEDWWKIEHLALAAIAAMEQPTLDMIEAGKHTRTSLHPSEKPETAIRKIWNAMIHSVTDSEKNKAEAFACKVMKK